jgi:cold-inducible RNA-binding protein
VFVGNLSYDVTRDELIEAFSAAGKVLDAKVPTDRETGRPRGFAFVEFAEEDAAQRSISLLNGRELKGRSLRVNEAENRPPRPAGSAGPSFRPGPRGPGAGAPPGAFREFPDFPAQGKDSGRTRRFKQKEQQREAPRREERRRGRRTVGDYDDDY